jgi:hypothetical protein
MTEIKRVKIDSLLESQIPEFLSEDSPLFVEFLRQYYKSLENQSGAIDLAVNLKKYKSIEKFNSIDLTKSTILTSDVLAFDDIILVESTIGWPDSYGLLKIDDEIITYTSKTSTSFNGCIRGFSGIDAIESLGKSEFLNFSETETSEHENQSVVLNLSNLFLVTFFEKFKNEFFPGFENRDFSEGLSIENILTSAKDFYISKGTDSSYKLLFKILYGTDIEILKPQDYTLVPSSNSFFSTKNILVEKISGGDPSSIRGNFLYQNISGVGTVSASIFNVEYRPIGEKSFYEISLDSTSLSGNFEVSGKTKVLEDVSVGSNNILVDSTIGFSKSGKILVKPENSDFIELIYGDKTTNQFLNVTGITKELKYGLDVVENKFAFSYVGLGNTTPINFRIVNVIDNVDFSSTSNMRVGDRVKLSGFGKNLISSVQFNSWIYNLPTTHNIRLTSQIDTNKFRIILYDFVAFYQNETVELVDENDNRTDVKIITVEFDVGDKLKRFSNRVLIQNLNINFDVNKAKFLRKKIYKTNHYSNYFLNLDEIPTGVQNTYIDNTESNFYVTSTGTPNYTIFVTDNKKIISTQGTGITTSFYSPSHNYVSGDVIYYNALYPNSGISTGFYYITRVDSNNFKLSYSKSDIFSKKYISVISGITSDTSIKAGYENKTLKNQKIVKKFPLIANSRLFDDPNKRTTNDRPIGLLANGVEILSPTLFDENIYYGTLQSIEVIDSGKNYDVVTPPPIEVFDDNGSLARGHVNLSGSIKRIKIISPGVGYQSKPKITITGGNGRGCSLESNLVKSRIELGFKADNDVSIANNTITFSNRVLFEDGEEVIYNANTNTSVPGFIDGAHYHVGIITDNVIKLFNTINDSISKQNEINISGISSGVHYLTSLKNKNTITEVYVKDSGEGYSNRKIKVPSVLSADNNTIGINTFDSYFFAKNHGFSDGDLVEYSTTDTPISGLSTSIYYYINVIDNNKFKLASAGIGTTLSNSNFIDKKYIKFNNLGLGTHTIGYPPIKITIESISAIGSTTIIEPVLEPIVLGSISDVYLEDGGVSYGSTDIINFHKRPNVGISSIKSQAILKPIIINGTIADVKIINKGAGYRKDSDVLIFGSGQFAEIDPIIDSQGRLSSVNILRGGVGYASSNTQLILKNRGENAKFLANVTEWKVNQVVKLKNQIVPEDDGFLYANKNNDLGLQYINFYVPKKLRYSLSDNFTETNKEISGSKSHSPILGYAYDGNPIYGPYGFDSTLGGQVRQIKSSYVLDLIANSQLRPQGFEPGYFVNDYIYNASNDLDENNGRFCVTPQYPNGTYAYFYSVSIDATNIATPVYPYIVGTKFYDLPIEDNFIPKFNQDFDIFDTTLSRNIAPYYLENPYSSYELIDKVSDVYKQEFRVSEIDSSSIEGVSIFSAGTGYKVNDYLVLDNESTSGTGANIVVSEIKGKDISDFSVVREKIEDVSFIIKSTKVIGICNSPHELVNNESIVISGISTITASLLEGAKKIQVTEKTIELLSNIDLVSNTGVSTFISVKDVSGFRDNDFIGIGTEKLLITKVSPERSGFYVNRIENTGIHTVGIDSVKLLPKIFEFKVDKPLDEYTLENTVTFFDPKETVGTGTAGVIRNIVGVGTSSIESRFIPARSIYLPGHKFFTGQELIYHPGVAATSIYVNNVGSGVSFKLEQNQKVYAVNLGKNYIGLSTLGFTTSSGIGTNLNSLEFWNLTEAFGVIGYAHSLRTINSRITGTLQRSTGIVTTTQEHGLQSGDSIDFVVASNSINEVKVKFDIINRKTLVNQILFSDSDVSIGSDSTINLESSNIKVKTGDKLVYFASTPIGGLNNGSIYYVLKEDDNKIQLCNFESDIKNSNTITFSSVGSVSQEFYFINPPLEFFKGSQIKFDLSDPSLLDMELYFYSDSQCSRRIDIIGSVEDDFAIKRNGVPGNSLSNVILDTNNKHFPSIFYYNLVPKSPIEESKTELSFDNSILGNNKVKIITHTLNSRFSINVVGDKKISFNVLKELNYFEILSLSSSEYHYTTNSLSANGPIYDLRINFGGRGYKKLPYIKNINSDNGVNAVIQLISPKVGRVSSYERIKDGFDYPTDPTLSPRLSIPAVCGIKDIRTIERINIVSGGNNYNNPPELLVKDNLNIQLRSNLTNGSISKVDIITNSTSLSEPLEIISIRNSNGYEIDTIVHSSPLVTLELSNTPGSNPLINSGFGKTEIVFPFKIGDEIFIENCRLTPSTKQNANFNSFSYNYAFFPVVGVDTSNNTITYDMTGISTGSFGTYDDELNLGVVINKNDMSVLEMVLNDDTSYKSTERVISKTFSANVMENGWDNKLNQLRLNDCFGTLNVNDSLYGENSKLTGIVEYFSTFDLDSTLGPFRDKIASVDNAVGILNDYQQRISDNFYYQKFAYSIKSDIPYNVWRESVRSTVHPSGFKEFSDLVIYTEPTIVGASNSTNMKPKILQTDSSLSVNIDNEVSMYDRTNFVRVYEDNTLEDGSVESVYFNDGINLRPFILNKTNKVLTIDDISDQFDGTSLQEVDGRYADASDLLQSNREFIMEEVVGFITATYPGITTNIDWDRSICKRDVGYIVDAISHDVKYKSNNKSIEAGLAYWSGIGTNYVSGETTETIEGFKYIIDLSKYIINNVGVKTSYQLESTVSISSVTYNNISGIATVGTTTSHGLSTTTKTYVVLKDLVFSCDSGGGINTAIFPSLGNGPDGNGPLSPKGFVYEVEVIDSTRFRVNPGPSTISHNYVSGGTAQRAFISTTQYIDQRILYDELCSPTYSENCCADVWTSIGNYIGIITSIIGIGTTSAPNSIVYPSLTRGGQVVGLTTFKLKNKGTPLFSHTVSSTPVVGNATGIYLSEDIIIIPNHNFQTGQELIYETTGTPIGIATTSYVVGITSILMTIDNANLKGTAILEQGYPVAIQTSITGISTTLVPPGPSFTEYLNVVGLATNGIGTDAKFNAFISYNITTGQAISTSLVLVSGGYGYSVGDVVSVAGTYLGGTSPTNDLTFVVSKVGPTGIQTRANEVYTNVPSIDLSGATFNVTRNNSGYVSDIKVVNGSSGYAYTSVVSIAGTYLGGSTYDYVSFSPSELGTNVLPKTLFVYKLNDNDFRVFGLSTSSRSLNIVGLGTGYHTFSYKNPNSSIILSIDGVVQSPLNRKSLNVSLGSSVSTSTTSILYVTTGISSLRTGDILNINDEYLLVESIGISSSNFVNVQRSFLGSVSGIHTVGASVTVLTGDFNIVKDVVYFIDAPYGKIGPIGLQTGSIFSGRGFSRSFDASDPLNTNIVLDDISLSFTGIAATEFTLKSNGQNTEVLFNDVNSASNISNNPLVFINNVFQVPQSDFTIDGTPNNVIRFLSGTPSAGKISKVAISTGFGYQPRIGAAATVVVSSAGTISNILLTGEGSGYRNPPTISIASTIGIGASFTATVGAGGTITGFTIVNAGSGYTSTSLPIITIGIPTGYSNLPVAYTGGSSGLGQGAKVTVEVGSGSSIISFKFDEVGRGYKVGDILSVPGITTNPSVGVGFSEFRITVQEVQTDKFNSFYPGQFVIFDDISSNFNGIRKKFSLTTNINGVKQILSLKTSIGSDLDITNNIFIFVNDILQTPQISYTFQGSRVSFKEPPKSGSKCTILYYRGSSIDIEEIDPPKTIKIGDEIIIEESQEDIFDITQFDRVVKKIVSSDQLDTFTYSSIGIDTNSAKNRPLRWKKQKKDRIINGTLYSKARPNLQSLIRPNASLIKDISPEDTTIYVDNVFPFFAGVDNLSEDLRDVIVLENKNTEAARATSIVSSSSTVSSINIDYPGVGYAISLSPVVNISLSAIKLKDPIYEWKGSNISGITTLSRFNSIASGQQIIAVGNSSLYASTLNGEEWQVGNVGLGSTTNFKSVYSVGFGNSDFIISVGSFGKIAKAVGYSNTISNWSQVDTYVDVSIPGFGVAGQVLSNYSGTLNDIVYSSVSNTWITVGAAGSIFVASGINTDKFINRFSRTIRDLNGVVFGADYFVAVGNDGTIVSSNTGLIWELNQSPVVTNLNKVIYAENKFVIVGNNGVILRSITRDSYQVLGTNLTDDLVNIKYYYGFYVVVTSSGNIFYSFDLLNWVPRSTLQPNPISDLIFDSSLDINGRYIAVGSAGTTIYADPVVHRATAISGVNSSTGIVTSITILDGGFGYSELDPPSIMIEPDRFISERIRSIKVKGDHGVIIGINTFLAGTPGIGTTSPKIEFVLKSESYDNSTLGIGYSSLSSFGIVNSQLEKGDYFVIADSNVLTGGSLVGISTFLGGMSNFPNSIVGIANTFIDGVYCVESVTTANSGIVTVTCHFAPMENNYVKVYKRGESNTGIGTNEFYGRYSWGKIYDFQNRSLSEYGPKAFIAESKDGISGLSTSAKVIRTRGLLSN